VWNTKPLHHGKAGGIGEGKIFVVVLDDDFSCSVFICDADADNGRSAVVYSLEGSVANNGLVG
jgi:hypothetical protein